MGTSIKKGAICWLAVTVCWWTLGAYAHRGSAVWTDIVWQGNHFQITHRLHAADALRVNRFMGGGGELDTLEDLARLALYVDQRFTLSVSDGTSSAIVTLGAELEDDFAFIYQEWYPAAKPTAFPPIVNDLLIDLVSDAQRFVRIETSQGIEERRF